MIINRNGQEFELTEQELFNAYLEQEYIYDLGDIRENLNDYVDENKQKELVENSEFMESAAYKLKKISISMGWNLNLQLKMLLRKHYKS